ncbi:MAG: type II toxin-antitoxin system RelE/ParE family toxin [Desulfobacterales bacterium]|nr:type II toxin-antitoxin system RelE/ParE family toxin [Desulfobacterales bacterium]
MKIRRTNSFLKDYRKLPKDICDRVDKQLSFLLKNPGHPSLRLKRLKGTERFEIRITDGYRLTFQYDEEVLELRRVGTHDLLIKEGS